MADIEEQTIRVRDLVRISVRSDEVLLLIVPDDYTPVQMKNMAEQLRHNLPGIADRIMVSTDQGKFATIKIHELDEFSAHRAPEISLKDMEKNWP